MEVQAWPIRRFRIASSSSPGWTSRGRFLFVDYSIPLLFPGTMNFAVAPISDDEAVIRGFGREMGETIRAVTVNGENMLSYSGYLLRKKECSARSLIRFPANIGGFDESSQSHPDRFHRYGGLGTVLAARMAGLLPAVFHTIYGDICHRSSGIVLDPDIQDNSIH